MVWHPVDIGTVVTSSDDCSVRVWRTDPFHGAEKCPYEAGEVIGRAVKAHRDIGINLLSQFFFCTSLYVVIRTVMCV